ncbi:MAG: DNA recombination protein RmuC [Spirochaetales bacterium]|nr:DNA recombination protein RmuC [Spirochaetales bacterium]
MNIALLTVGSIIVILLAVATVRLFTMNKYAVVGENKESFSKFSEDIKQSITQSARDTRGELSDSIQKSVNALGENLYRAQEKAEKTQSERLVEMQSRMQEGIGNITSALTVQLETMDKKLSEIQTIVNEKLDNKLRNMDESLRSVLTDNQKQASDAQRKQIEDMSSKMSVTLDEMNKNVAEKQDAAGKNIGDRLQMLETRFKTLEEATESKLESMRTTIATRLDKIHEDNNKKLSEIQTTVNEKLESKMNESFKRVSEQLENVHRGLGEMQNIAAGVGDLKRVLSNVKTRGTLGEIQLGAILQEILSPGQYETNVVVIPSKDERVEFAVKLPGKSGDSCVYLPIDSKFPGDTYAALQDAYDTGDKERIDTAKKQLWGVLKKCAADIKNKYIEVPYTTNFGIMFLPFEGLYAEVAASSLIEELQHNFKVIVAGPSTMAATLSSLRMGFNTLAIQKKTDEVWTILSAVKSEFGKFENILTATQKNLRKVDEDLEKLVGTRTRQIIRKLKDVETTESSTQVLGIDD